MKWIMVPASILNLQSNGLDSMESYTLQNQ